MRLILASQSPRRQQLLQSLGLDFEIVLPSEGAETPPRPGEAPIDLVRRLGREKAADVAAQVDQAIVIGCDTVADCNGIVLGKPKDRIDAEQMLRTLRGQEHRVHSGLCLWRRPDDQVSTSVESTVLFMRAISDRELNEYLDSNLWEGKAGAFGYQDRTGWLEIVSGSESNVVGLPLELLQRELAAMMGDRSQ